MYNNNTTPHSQVGVRELKWAETQKTEIDSVSVIQETSLVKCIILCQMLNAFDECCKVENNQIIKSILAVVEQEALPTSLSHYELAKESQREDLT